MFSLTDPLSSSIARRIVLGYMDLHLAGIVHKEVIDTSFWWGERQRNRETLLDLFVLYENLTGTVHPLDALLP